MSVSVFFDEQKIKVGLQEVIAEKGEDYVYPRAGRGSTGDGCRYFENDGSPSCIVGHLLAKRGVTYDALLTLKFGAEMNESTSASGLVGARVIDLDPSQADLLREFLVDVQALQDMGVAWGKAFSVALDRHQQRKVGRYLNSIHGVFEDEWLPEVPA